MSKGFGVSQRRKFNTWRRNKLNEVIEPGRGAGVKRWMRYHKQKAAQ
jgi:hypothetical protein